MARGAARLSDAEARALVEQEKQRGFGGARWHMRPAGEDSPARRLSPDEVDVRWLADAYAAGEKIVNVGFSSYAATDAPEPEELDPALLADEEEAPTKRRAGRPKGSKNTPKPPAVEAPPAPEPEPVVEPEPPAAEAPKAKPARTRSKLAGRRDAVARPLTKSGNRSVTREAPAPPPEQGSVIAPPAAGERVTAESSRPVRFGEQMPLFGEEFWREAIRGLPRNQRAEVVR